MYICMYVINSVMIYDIMKLSLYMRTRLEHNFEKRIMFNIG